MTGNREEESFPLDELNIQNVGDIRTRRNIFMQVDVNQDGTISINELNDFIQKYRKQCKMIPKDIVKKIHKQADKDGDKNLDFEEFTYLITHRNFQEFLGYYANEYVNYLIPRPKGAQTSIRLQRVSERDDGYEEDDQSMLDEYTCCPPPIFLFVISILELIFFITDELKAKDSTLTGSGVFAQLFIYDPVKREEAWRYLTYIFVHIGVQHLCVNLVVQLVLGIPLEMVHKWWRVLIIYITGGIAGSLMHSICDPSYKLGGASGSVYALLTAHVSNVIMNWSEMSYPIVQLMFMLVLIVADVGTSAYQRYYLKYRNNIGVSAHLGGAIAGLLVGIYTLRNLRVTKVEKYFWWMALIIYMLLMGAAIIINISCPHCFL